MMEEKRSRELINAYCSGHASSDEIAELDALLRESADARRLFLEYRSMEVSLRATASVVDGFSVERNRNVDTIPSKWQGWGLALAAAAAVVLGLFLYRPAGAHPAIATVAEIGGLVHWVGDGGRREALSKGASINGGTIETASGGSFLTLVYEDASTITLASDTIAVLSVDNRKRVYLREGSVDADIVPQKEGNPAVVETPAARYEILGTRFAIAAEPASSFLNVTEGVVRATRKVDGQALDVGQNQSAVATLETLEGNWSAFAAEATGTWGSDIGSGPRGATGHWIPSTDSRPASLRATPFLFQREGEDPIVVYRTLLPVSVASGGFVRAASDTYVEVYGSLERSGLVEIMLSTGKPEGGFGGNYFYRFEQEASEAFELRVPIAQFKSELEARGPIAGRRIRVAGVLTTGFDGGLAIEQVALGRATLE